MKKKSGIQVFGIQMVTVLECSGFKMAGTLATATTGHSKTEPEHNSRTPGQILITFILVQ